MDRMTWLAPLGLRRNCIFGCHGGEIPSSPAHFMPPDDVDIFDAFRSFITERSRRGENDTDPFTISSLAAGRLLIGDLVAAELIIDHLAAEPSPLPDRQVFASAAPSARDCSSLARQSEKHASLGARCA
jgi:hypothetical protein